jgi:4-aminobutyrate aminotransferase
LMIDIEFVKDKGTKEPNEELRNMVEKTAFEYGLLLLGCGKSVIRLAPPLSISKSEMDEALEIFENVVTMAEKEQGLR